MIHMKRYKSWRKATPEEREHIENVVKREYIRAGDIVDALLKVVVGFSLLLWLSVPTVAVPFYQDCRIVLFIVALVIIGIRRLIVSCMQTKILVSPLDDAVALMDGRVRKARKFDLPANWAEPVIVRYGRHLMRFC